MIFLYQFLLQIIRFFKFFFRIIPHKKISYFFQNEGTVQTNSPFQAKPIWVHASSGEIEYAKSLIRELKSNYPEIPILVTHTSLSSLNSLKNLEVTGIGVAPLDTPQDVSAFLTRWNPRVCLIARTDIWPQTLIELSRFNIPAYLFSATFAHGSKKINFASRRLLKACLPLLKKIYFVSANDENLCRQYFQNITGEVLGDTRYDQVTHRLKENFTAALKKHDKTLIAGSTWGEDEKVLIPAFAHLQKNNWKLILVPHEVDSEHMNKITHQLRVRDLKFHFYSEGLKSFSWAEYDVLLVDKVGILASLYTLADVAFIGGSFKRQVHSVMEALATDSPVVLGPYFQNNREAIAFEALGFVRSVMDSGELIKSVEFFEKNLEQLKPQLQAEVKKRLGATQRLIQDLKSQGLFA